MATFRHGTLIEVLEDRPDLVRAKVEIGDAVVEAIGFPHMLGPVRGGDRVVVNTTGIELALGTGDVGFILWNLDGPGPTAAGPGHIVKMRYTPWQSEVLAVEAPESPHHERLKDVDAIGGMPVVACSVHSQIAAVAAGIRAERPDARIGYLMTDGAALPLAWSDLVRRLRSERLIDATCTVGHAFGGELEAINVFSGFAALRTVAEVDVTIVAMGPGIVGTGTALGSTGIEQGQLLDAATALGGRAIACLRIAFADDRPRHRGVSHHTLTALRVAATQPCTVVVPSLPDERATLVAEQLLAAGIRDRHRLVTADGAPALALLVDLGLRPTSMGRTIDEVPELFLAGGAAGRIAARAL